MRGARQILTQGSRTLPAEHSECAYAAGKWLVKSSSRRRFRRGGERFLSDGAAARREIVRQCSLWERNE